MDRQGRRARVPGRTTEQTGTVIAAIDELQAIDLVFQALPNIRRLSHPVGVRPPRPVALAAATGLEGCVTGSGPVDEAILELIHTRLKAVASSLQSTLEAGRDRKGGRR